ncbi:DUF3293 domain-containing protein [Castellaniella ginsengisoli]|uniref:DUF3293 domain-containing protein n=1 Tax=Castellaniella ginsengisoli TaxID=546114 RepID=A0AB39DAF5_9BURK
MTPGGHPLDAAYRAAHYRIETAPPLILRIGQAHPALAARFPHGGVFLTACNPRSRRLRPAANARRMRALCRAVERAGHAWLPGRGLDPHGSWPDEPSLWMPGLPLESGLRLARRFGQNALVWCGPDTVARLVWTGPSPTAQARHIC